MLDMQRQSGMHPYFGGPLMRKWLVIVLLLGIVKYRLTQARPGQYQNANG